MIRIALLEDEQEAADLLRENLDRYSAEYGVEFNVTHFTNALSFIADYKKVYDIVFMDIMMPDMNGLDAAKKLRELDKSVILIFLTNLAQYAIRGYETDALDFVIKPISYYVLVMKLERAIERIEKSQDFEVSLSIDNSMVRLKSTHIKYVEVTGHKLIYHTNEGNYRVYGSMRNAEDALAEGSFARCNNCYLVNLRYVRSIRGYTVDVDGEELQISHPKRKDFVKAMNDFLGRGGD